MIYGSGERGGGCWFHLSVVQYEFQGSTICSKLGKEVKLHFFSGN